MDTFPFIISNSTQQINVTSYTESCDPITYSYDVIYNVFGLLQGNFVFCGNNEVCLDEPVRFYIDPSLFTPSLDGIIEWTYACNSGEESELINVWTYDSIIANTFIDDHCGTGDIKPMIVFEHQFDESSCGCVFEDAGGVFTRYDEFRVLAEYVTECFTAQLTDGTSIEARPTPTAAYSVPDSLCVDVDVVIVNNSSFHATIQVIQLSTLSNSLL